MASIEDLIAHTWAPVSRSLAQEAWACYNAGAMRGSIVVTWAAVLADIVAKASALAESGDAVAKQLVDAVHDAQAHGLATEGVRKMQAIENGLLDKAVALELIDDVDKRDLERVAQDRHLSAHASLRPFGESYEPSAELARAHLTAALRILLVQPPTQGKKIIEGYGNWLASAYINPEHLYSTFISRARSSVQRRLIAITVKHALLELSTSQATSPEAFADNCALALSGIAAAHRDTVRAEFDNLYQRFAESDPVVQYRAVIRLGHADYFWDAIGGRLDGHLDGLMRGTTDPAALSLAGNEIARHHLPSLDARLASLPDDVRITAYATRPSRWFVEPVIDLLKTAWSYRTAELVGRTMLVHAEFLTSQNIDDALAAWVGNDQCQFASAMPEIAAQLFQQTAKLGKDRLPAFQNFVTSIEHTMANDTINSPDYVQYYSYPHLAKLVQQACSATE